MCDKKISSIVHAQQAPVERVAELMTTAETELAAFYEAVFRQYGLQEAKNAAQDWIEELGTMDWPDDWALPNWRDVTIAAADCLALRIINPCSGPMTATALPSRLDFDQFAGTRKTIGQKHSPQKSLAAFARSRTQFHVNHCKQQHPRIPGCSGKCEEVRF